MNVISYIVNFKSFRSKGIFIVSTHKYIFLSAFLPKHFHEMEQEKKMEQENLLLSPGIKTGCPFNLVKSFTCNSLKFAIFTNALCWFPVSMK